MSTFLSVTYRYFVRYLPLLCPLLTITLSVTLSVTYRYFFRYFYRFAGADDTYTIEALMQNGWALQSGTAHFLGKNAIPIYNLY
jgi:hypothetical protein